MKKKILLASMAGLLAVTGINAQTVAEVQIGKKVDVNLEQLLRSNPTALRVAGMLSKNVKEQKVSVFIQCDDAQVVADFLTDAGHQATVVMPEMLTAAIPLEMVDVLAAREDVRRIEKSRQLRPLLAEARKAIGVDDIHSGTELETPFTGEGVIVGVIDQGFEYKHIAFMDKDGKKSRVRAVWNRNGYPNATSSPTTFIPSGGDGFDAGGHGTHVAGIAAGSKIDDNDFYGIAPDAELIMIPSTFADAEVVEDVQYIKEFAEEEGKPWVVNMSFGGNIGPHDGTSTANQSLASLMGPGGLIAAAMGNDGDANLHATYTFKEDGDKCHIFVDMTSSDGLGYFEIWRQEADGKKSLTVKPLIYSNSKGIDYKTTAFWNTYCNIGGEVSPQNQKEYHTVQSQAGKALGTGETFGVEVTGKKGQVIHVWCGSGYGNLKRVIKMGILNSVRPDAKYLTSECGATTPGSIGVGSFNSATGWTAYNDNKWYGYGNTPNFSTLNAISAFSSPGPSLHPEDLKPTVMAPGSIISSAVSQYSASFDKTSLTISDVVTRGTKKFYYQTMVGTSMASPAMAGTLALWLQAYPKLTPAQTLEIIRTTAKRDSWTAHSDGEEWNSEAGYGKVDAYAGLKAALKLAEQDVNGINDVLNSESPVTLSKGHNEWKVLFNNDESYADIALYAADGALVQAQHLASPRRGEETIVSLAGLTPGVYVIRINTTLNTMTRKVMVK